MPDLSWPRPFPAGPRGCYADVLGAQTLEDAPPEGVFDFIVRFVETLNMQAA